MASTSPVAAPLSATRIHRVAAASRRRTAGVRGTTRLAGRGGSRPRRSPPGRGSLHRQGSRGVALPSQRLDGLVAFATRR